MRPSYPTRSRRDRRCSPNKRPPERGLSAQPVHSPHDTDARKHRRAVMFDHQEHRFDRGLPFREVLFALRELLDIFGGVLEGDELASARQRDWLVEASAPAALSYALHGLLSKATFYFCGLSCNSNVPKRYSSSASLAVLTSVNVASGNCRQIAKSSAVTVSQPNLNMYRPGSVTRPAFCHVILLIAAGDPNSFRSIWAASVRASIPAISERGALEAASSRTRLEVHRLKILSAISHSHPYTGAVAISH